MGFIEKDLETVLHKAMGSQEKFTELVQRGFYTHGNKRKPYMALRQVAIQGAGIADLVCVYRRRGKRKHYIDVVVYELKLKKTCLQASEQCKRYINGIGSVLEQRGVNVDAFSLSGVVIGGDFSDKNWRHVDFETVIKVQTFDWNISGLEVTSHNGFYFNESPITDWL
jgi:hypothetical protein